MQDSHRQLSVRRTFVRAVRTSWDALGFTCAISLTLTAACMPLAGAAELHPGAAAIAGIATYALVLAPIFAGGCRLARLIAAHDEAGYHDLWRGAAALYGRAAALGAMQALVIGAVASDGVLLWRLGGAAGIAGAVIMAYLLLFWCMSMVYQWPLLVAADEGLLARADGRRIGLIAVIRNAFVMTVSAPGFTLAILLVIIVSVPALACTGIGLSMVGGGFIAHLLMQAGSDQLIRFGALPPPPDVDSPVEDAPWHVR